MTIMITGMKILNLLTYPDSDRRCRYTGRPGRSCCPPRTRCCRAGTWPGGRWGSCPGSARCCRTLRRGRTPCQGGGTHTGRYNTDPHWGNTGPPTPGDTASAPRGHPGAHSTGHGTAPRPHSRTPPSPPRCRYRRPPGPRCPQSSSGGGC